MKTLKQLLKIYSPILLADEIDRDNAIMAVKEWLQQKQANVRQISMRYEVYKELLEELKQ